ncbi:MAG: ABC transporter ATP-binding protein [Candidatus Thorarchaeota archaeon]
MTCAIDILNLSFSYGSFSIKNINTELHQCEHKALIGPNGSGKTTLFRLLVGLLRPASGEIYVNERLLTDESLWEIRKDIGFLFQNPEDQLFAPTVWEDVAFGPRNLGLPDDEVQQRVRDALHFVGMDGFEHRPINSMSYGQAKRVALAGILAMRPRILLLDEPFDGLDFPMTRVLAGMMRVLREQGVSVLFTTHNRFFVENWADSVVALRDGEVIFDGPVKHALQDPNVIEILGDWDSLRGELQRSRICY